MRLLGVLFDLDGTLIHTLPDITGVLNIIRTEFHLPPLEDKDVRSYVGKGAEHLIRESFKSVVPLNPGELLNKFRRSYLHAPHSGGYLYDGVEETLVQLRDRKHIKLGVVTNKSTAVAERTLQYYLPRITFDIIAGPERVSQKKPHPAHILEVLAGLNVEPSRAWFVGDDPVDAEAALAARVHFLAAGYGFGGVRAGVADNKILNDFKDILKMIPLD